MIRFLRTSVALVFHSILIGFILVAFLYGLFLILPNRVFFSAEVMIDSIKYSNCEIEKLDMEVNSIDIDGKEVLYLQYYGKYFVVNGKEYYHKNTISDLFRIIPNDEEKSHIRIKASEYTRQFHFKYTKSDNNDKCNDEISYEYEKGYHSDKMNLKAGYGYWSIDEADHIEIHLSNCKLDISMYDEVIEEEEIEIKISGVNSLVPSKCEFRASGALLSYIKINALNICNIEKDSVKNSEGKITVFYKAKPEEFALYESQELSFYNRDKVITANIGEANNHSNCRFAVLFNGYADQLDVSNNSLIPSFTNMIKENVYISPTILVTMIGGAITLITKKEGKQKKSEAVSSNCLQEAASVDHNPQLNLSEGIISKECIKDEEATQSENGKRNNQVAVPAQIAPIKENLESDEKQKAGSKAYNRTSINQQKNKKSDSRKTRASKRRKK